MAETTTDIATRFNVANFLSSVRLPEERVEESEKAELEKLLKEPRPMISENLSKVMEDVSAEERFISSLAAVFHNIDPDSKKPFDKQHIQDLVQTIDELVNAQLNEIMHNPEFKALEATWTSIQELCRNTNFKKDIQISLIDVSKEKAFEDLELNSADIAGSELFKKLYVAEYDQYGGSPYGGLIGLYEFANTSDDRLWLSTIGKIATAAHAPFVASVSPAFFGCSSMAEVNELRDLAGMMSTPKYSAWTKLRDSEEAAYLGLVLPRFIVRAPYNPESNPARGIHYTESVTGDDEHDFLWGNAATLFAQNLVRSFENTGWCQHIRGPKGGGQILGLPSYEFSIRGEKMLKLPVEIAMPDFRELELANAGFIPLIQKKGSAEAVFFSAQSIKLSKQFKDPKDSENSQLVTNLSYTYSVARIAHYLKCIMRDNIGSSANVEYIHSQIDRWIAKYVTALVNPDDLTLRYYPFKAYSLEVKDVPGRVGWYHCNLSILPHVQFEGMDVDLRVEARLG